MPGTARWKAQHLLALNTLQAMGAEMQDYFENRTEGWQEGERGQAMMSRLELLDDVIAAVQELEIN